MLDEYQLAANTSTERQNGWPKQAYAVSKAAMNAMTATLARENEGLVINSCCPGWVATDMGRMVGSTPSKAPGMLEILPISGAWRLICSWCREWSENTDSAWFWRYWWCDG